MTFITQQNQQKIRYYKPTIKTLHKKALFIMLQMQQKNKVFPGQSRVCQGA